MRLITKIIKWVSKLLRFAMRNNKRAQDKINQVIKQTPTIKKPIQRALLEPLQIKSMDTIQTSSQTQKKEIKVNITNKDYRAWVVYYRKVIAKEERGLKLSTQEQMFRKFFDEILVEDNKRDEVFYFDNSSFLVMLIYKKGSKTALIRMKGGKMLYPFYNVPRTKVIKLILENGKFMWDYFGKHYSTNPKHWIRKGDKK